MKKNLACLADQLLTYNYAYEIKPFEFSLGDGSVCEINEIIHLVPQTRLLAFGKWSGKAIFVKLFFHKKIKEIQYSKDINGVRTLLNKQILTPELYYAGLDKENEIYVAIFERYFDVKTLFEIWRNSFPRTSEATLTPILLAVEELAHQHDRGIYQADPNAKNYLVKDNKIITIDGTQIKLFEKPLSKQEGLEHLAIFLSHFGLRLRNHYKNLVKAYIAKRQWHHDKQDTELFNQLIRARYRNGMKRLQRKIFTSNRNYHDFVSHKRNGFLDRRFGTPAVLEFLRSHSNLIEHPDSQLIKKNEDSDFYKIKVDKYHFIIRKIKEGFFSNKARKAWSRAHQLYYLGYSQIKPVAFLQKNNWGFDNTSYFIGELRNV